MRPSKTTWRDRRYASLQNPCWALLSLFSWVAQLISTRILKTMELVQLNSTHQQTYDSWYEACKLILVLLKILTFSTQTIWFVPRDFPYNAAWNSKACWKQGGFMSFSLHLYHTNSRLNRFFKKQLTDSRSNWDICTGNCVVRKGQHSLGMIQSPEKGRFSTGLGANTG